MKTTTLTTLVSILVMSLAVFPAVQDTRPAFSGLKKLEQGHRFPLAGKFDVDRDGDIDFFTYSGDSAPRWLEVTGDGRLVEHVFDPNERSSHLAAGDLDGDKDIDFVGCNSVDGILGFKSLKNGKAFKRTILISRDDLGMSARSVGVGDFDSDGKLDVMAAGKGVKWIRNQDGKGESWSAPESAYPSTRATALHVRDFDKDGDPDAVFVKNRSKLIYLKNDKGRFTESLVHDAGSSEIRVVHVRDFDKDGYPDILVSNGDRLDLYENAEGEAFGATALLPAKNHITLTNVDAFDFDKDGDLDILVSRKNNSSVLVNSGNGKWSGEKEIYKESGSTMNENRGWAADLNGDKLDDVVFFPYRGDTPTGTFWIQNRSK